jgi:hypothetical protein
LVIEEMAKLALARRIAAQYARLAPVEAVALGGSLTTDFAGADSDIDLYVYSRTALDMADRRRIATAAALHAEVDNRYWEPGDEWIDRASRTGADVMFRDMGWTEDALRRLLNEHQAAVGYSTALWHNVRRSAVLFDRSGWFGELQAFADQDYPATLQRAIIAKNYPLLRQNISSYLRQIEKAVARGDLVSINHRLAALLASYFDIVFAVNRLPHPGEKRQIAIAERACRHLPAGMARQVTALLAAGARADTQIGAVVHDLVDGLDALLREVGLAPWPRELKT